MNSNKKFKTAIMSVVFSFMLCGSCNFLDVVPDNELTLDQIFFSKESAYNGLAKIYYYLPSDFHIDQSTWLLGDDFASRIDQDHLEERNRERAITIMRGEQSN